MIVRKIYIKVITIVFLPYMNYEKKNCMNLTFKSVHNIQDNKYMLIFPKLKEFTERVIIFERL